jgi:hypothetical protein
MKIRISKVLDVSKFLETEAGNQLKDVLMYLGEFTQQIVQAVGGKLSYVDNFLSEVKTITAKNNEEITVSVNGKRIFDVRVIRSLSPEFYIIERFGWKYDNSGNINLTLAVTGSPTQPIQYEILILY